MECKSCKAGTWVCFIRDETFDPWDERAQLRTLEAVQSDDFNVKKLPHMIGRPLLGHFGSYAYEVRDTGAKSEAYNAVRQVVSAAVGIKETLRLQEGSTEVVYLLPVIVTSAPLFTVHGTEGEPIVEPAERVLLITNVVSGDREHSVWIVQEEALLAFVDDMRTTVR